ncbi:hypothetical protein BgramDRAFT_6730 [Paraburkholderia graminis C4D1M]|uniref:Uncharacterized protein n=1 Tax=Paraburkholderia graminis (strain ATCC 700544 / DSM 17151 / LMG 18924 / NCIMB 13744 / C4D1M) TaxID=396598 RepID=B1GBJ3_PARG4|nr:hypothetical protein BgramDRAFT_6730 [Paraburkholderia graminis C4D1M]
MRLRGRDRRAVRIEHVELDVGLRGRRRLRRVLERAPDEFHMHGVARTIHRPVRDRVDLRVVDLAVVIEILGHEHAALRIDAEHIAALGADVLQQKRAVAARRAALQNAHAVGPVHVRIRDRLAVVAPRGPHQHSARCRLHDRDGIRHEQQRMRAIVADHGFDDIKPRRQLAHRNHHVARACLDKVTAAAREVHAFGRLDHFRVPDRIAKARDHVIALQRRELRVLFKLRLLAGLLAEPELRRGFGCLAAGRERKHTLPCAARLGEPAVPQISERVREPFALIIRRDIQPMQILLRLQKVERFAHAIHDDVRAAVGLQCVLEIAAGRFEPNLRGLIAAEARIREQEERLTVHLLRAVVARRRGVQCGIRCDAGLGRGRARRCIVAGERDAACRRERDGRKQRRQDKCRATARAAQPVAHRDNGIHSGHGVKKSKRDTPTKFGLPSSGCQRESFHCIRSETATARRPVSVGVTVPV